MDVERIPMIVRPVDAIELLRISRSTLWRWEQKGYLPPRVEIARDVWVWLGEDWKQWLFNLRRN